MRTSRPVGVGTLMYVGDVTPSDTSAIVWIRRGGIAALGYGLLTGNKTARNVGAAATIVSFLVR